MPYLYQTIHDVKSMEEPFFGVTFPPAQVAEADRLEVWASSFQEGGGDYSEFRLMKGETQVAVKRISGY